MKRQHALAVPTEIARTVLSVAAANTKYQTVLQLWTEIVRTATLYASLATMQAQRAKAQTTECAPLVHKDSILERGGSPLVPFVAVGRSLLPLASPSAPAVDQVM